MADRTYLPTQCLAKVRSCESARRMVRIRMKQTPEKVRQHTVPKRYLKGFAKELPRLTQYDRKTGAAYPVSLNDASVCKRAYSIKDGDGIWDDSIENYFERVELEGCPVIERLVVGQVPSHAERCALARYMARQIQRGQDVAHAAKREAEKFKDKEFALRQIRANEEIYVRKLGSRQKFEAALRQFKERGTGVEIDEKAYLRPLILDTPPYAEIFADLAWRVEVAKHGFFVTSDRPVAIRRRGQPVNPHVVRINERGAELYFPLNLKCVLIASDAPARERRRKVSAARVRELNRITVINSYRFVFAPESSRDLDGLVKEHSGDRIQFDEMKW